jgi:Vam6/Vps39-like protein vacuolar protein sorting-associated protein 39
MNEERIVARLRGVQRAATEEGLLKERNRRVVVGEDRLCGVCMKRFGGSAVRVYPDGRVVHYGCFNRGTAASTGWAKAPASPGWA